MTEVWKSTANRFCKYCKCWVADNAVSWAGHEQGVRHKKAVEDKLNEMKRKQIQTDKSAKDEAHWLRKMEEAALKDYKSKDITNSRDFTAKLYNNEELPDVHVQYEAGPSKVPGGGAPDIKKKAKKSKIDPMMEVTGSEPDKWDKDYEAKIADITPVAAPTSGTKWHKPGVPKNWYEANTAEGHKYYWHVHTQESRWDAPPCGFVSIAEQTKLANKKVEKAVKKVKVAEESREIHGEHVTREREIRALPDMSIKDPYGGGGWSAVEKYWAEEPVAVDLGLPAKKEKQPVIEAHPDHIPVWKEKTVETGSLGDNQEDTASYSKPVITFRKRKNQSIRQREDD